MTTHYIVLELETGFMDGWYSDKAAQGMDREWDRKRPRFTHVLLSGNVTPNFPDWLFLPRVHAEELAMAKRKTVEAQK